MRTLLAIFTLVCSLTHAADTNRFVTGQRYNLSFEVDSLTAPQGWPERLSNYVRQYDFRRVSPFIGMFTNSAAPSEYATNLVNTYAGQVYPLRPQGGTNAWFFLLGGVNDLIPANYPDWVVINALSNAWELPKADGFKVYAITLSVDNAYTNLAFGTKWTNVNNYIVSASNQWHKLFRLDLLFTNSFDTNIFFDGRHFTTNAQAIIAAAIGDTLLPDIDPTPASFNTLNVGTLTISR